jgi:predicted nucleic acid-binding protein
MFLLDTNVISELRSGKPRQSAAVRAWAQTRPVNQLYLSAITRMELEIGVRRMERKDPAQGAVLRAWSEAVLHQFGGRVLPFTDVTALLCAGLHVPDPRSFRDSMIAATALEHGFIVVTRNTADFAGAGVQLVDPFADVPADA